MLGVRLVGYLVELMVEMMVWSLAVYSVVLLAD